MEGMEPGGQCAKARGEGRTTASAAVGPAQEEDACAPAGRSKREVGRLDSVSGGAGQKTREGREIKEFSFLFSFLKKASLNSIFKRF
jgi:hypothetical protein